MEPLSLIGLGAGIAGAATNLWARNKAADLTRQSGLERARREAMQYQQTLGEGQAAAGASGLVYREGEQGPGTSSMALYLNGLSQEFARRNAWNERMANEGADLQKLSAGLGAATDIASSVFSFGQANKWWAPRPSVQ